MTATFDIETIVRYTICSRLETVSELVFRVITPPDRTQLNSTVCRNSELVQTDATDRKLDDLS